MTNETERIMIRGMTYDDLNALYRVHYGEERPTTRLHPDETHDEDGNRRRLWFYPIELYYVLLIDGVPVSWRGYKNEVWFMGDDPDPVRLVGDSFTVPEHRGKGYLTQVKERHRRIHKATEIMGTVSNRGTWLAHLRNDGFVLNPEPHAHGRYWEFEQYYAERGYHWGIRPYQ